MIQPNDFLASADACLAANTHNAHEVHIRSTISRAYYAAFHHTKERAKSHGIDVQPPAEHRALIEALQGHPDQALRIAGNRLVKLRDKRTKADYLLHTKLEKSEANQALVAARTLINDF